MHKKRSSRLRGFLPWTLSSHYVTRDKSSHSGFISSVTPPMNKWVSRLRPSVPRGLSPSMCGSLSTLSMALRRLRVTTSWCQRPWLICTLLTNVPVPEPVLNLRREDTKHNSNIQSTSSSSHFISPEFTAVEEVILHTIFCSFSSSA